MNTIIFGGIGVGKTKLLAKLASDRMTEQGRADVTACRREVETWEDGAGLSLPEKHMVFSDIPLRSEPSRMPVRKSYYAPIERVGLYNPEPNEKWPQTWFFPPHAQFFFSEAQRMYNARLRGDKALPDHVSRWYETERHNGHNVTMDCQRPGLIDVNIRAITAEFICVLGSQDKRDKHGRVLSSTWDTLVFFDYASVEAYINAGEKAGAERRQYKHEGIIYRCYDSYCYKGLHREGREGCRFDLVTL